MFTTNYNSVHQLDLQTYIIEDFDVKQNDKKVALNTPYLMKKLTPGTYLLASEQADHQYLRVEPETKTVSVIKTLQNLGSLSQIVRGSDKIMFLNKGRQDSRIFEVSNRNGQGD